MFDWIARQLRLRKIFEELRDPKSFTNYHRRAVLFQEAIECIDPKVEPQLWASLTNELGLALAQDEVGDRTANIRKAVSCFEVVLNAAESQGNLLLWSLAKGNLATTYGVWAEIATDDRQRSELWEKAIQTASEQVAEWETVYIPGVNPNSDRSIFDEFQEHYIWQQAKTQAYIGLGEAYRKRLVGNALDNSTRAAEFFSKAFEAYEYRKQAVLSYFNEWQIPSDIPLGWTIAKADYGIYLLSRWDGDIADNIERSIECLLESLEMHKVSKHYKPEVGTTPLKPQDFVPHLLPRIYKHLGIAYSRRLIGDKTENQNRSLSYLKKALDFWENYPGSFYWADITYTSAALIPEPKSLKQHDVDAIIQKLEKARHIFKDQGYLTQWALTTGFIVFFYLERSDRTTQHLHIALQYANEALQTFDPTLQTVHAAKAYDVLGDVYRALQNTESAISAYASAIKVLEPTAYYPELRTALFKLGEYYFTLRDWFHAHEVYQRALDLDTDFANEGFTDAERRKHLSTTAVSYQEAAYSLIHLNRLQTALEVMEAGKTRLLREMMLPIKQHQEDDEIVEARQQFLRLDAEYRLEEDTPARRSTSELSDLLRIARDNYKKAKGDKSGWLKARDILDAIPEHSAIVYFLVTAQGSYAFCIPYNTEEVTKQHLVPIENLNTESYSSLILGTDNEPGWINSYLARRRNDYRKRRDMSWPSAVEALLGRVWHEVMQPIHAYSFPDTVNNLILIPYGLMQLVPLHAASVLINGNLEYPLCNKYKSVSYVPSMYALIAANTRLNKSMPNRATIVGVDEYVNQEPLHSAAIEAKIIGLELEASPILNAHARKSQIIESMLGSEQAHFACHGVFSWFGDVQQAGIHFHGEVLYYADILLLDLRHLRLVTLSACETGIIDTNNPSEAVGLPTAFLQAGVANVVASLWSVDDYSTFLLMIKMYENLNKMSPSNALLSAQNWLRRSTKKTITEYLEKHKATSIIATDRRFMSVSDNDLPYAHPLHWAAFTCSGRVNHFEAVS